MKSPWPTKKLGEICEIIAGQAPPSQFYNEEGEGIPFLTVNSFGRLYPKITRWTTKPLRIATEKDVLFSVAGSLGLVNLGINACITRSIFALRPKENYITQKFLFYVLKKFGPIMALSGSGAAQKVITIEQIKNFQIPLPPLPIQQKIVSILDTIQSAIEVQEKIIEKTKELKKSMMAELFKYGGPSFRKGRKLKKTEIGEIPEEWEVVRLGEAFSIYAGGDITKINYSPVKTGEYIYPIYSNTTENKGLYGFSDAYQYPENCITVTGRGNLGYAIPRFEKFNAIIRLLVLVPKEEFDIFFVSEYINAKIKVIMENTSIPQLTVPRFSSFKIPFPPLSEQREIAEILQTIDQKIEIVQKKKALYEELFKMMLNKIMNQEVDVEKVKI